MSFKKTQHCSVLHLTLLQIALKFARPKGTKLPDTISKAADPGKFKDKKKWAEWEPAFCNYLVTIPGVTGVPLSYVVCEKKIPDDDITVEYKSFNEHAVACAPLTGTVLFQADSRKVHHPLKSFLQAETAEQWIKSIERKLNGRQDMIVLRDHCAGEGNTSRRIAMAERIRDSSLHYKMNVRCHFPVSSTNYRKCLTSLKSWANQSKSRQRFASCWRRLSIHNFCHVFKTSTFVSLLTAAIVPLQVSRSSSMSCAGVFVVGSACRAGS